MPKKVIFERMYFYIFAALRALSSVGSEHLVYTEGVGGSNPSAPTTENLTLSEVFLFP